MRKIELVKNYDVVFFVRVMNEDFVFRLKKFFDSEIEVALEV